MAVDARTGGKLMRADLAARGLGGATFTQLLFAGRRQPLARWPNFDAANPYGGGWAHVDGKVVSMSSDIPGEDKRTLVIKPDDARQWLRPTDGEVFVFPRWNWWNNIVRIAAVDPATRRVTLAADCSYAIRPGDRFFVQGMREELDAHGEWYHDRESKTLLFLPPEPLDPFRRFLEVAAQCNGEIINFSSIARDVGVDHKTVASYFEILEDTLLGFMLEPWHASVRKRQRQAPKFWWFDPGVARALAGTLTVDIVPRSGGFGRAFEHFVMLEIIRAADYARSDFRFSYLRTKDDAEIDLIVERPGQPAALVEIRLIGSRPATSATSSGSCPIFPGRCRSACRAIRCAVSSATCSRCPGRKGSPHSGFEFDHSCPPHVRQQLHKRKTASGAAAWKTVLCKWNEHRESPWRCRRS